MRKELLNQIREKALNKSAVKDRELEEDKYISNKYEEQQKNYLNEIRRKKQEMIDETKAQREKELLLTEQKKVIKNKFNRNKREI